LFAVLKISRMKPGQKTIYWIAGMSQEEVARSPFAEKLVAEVRPQLRKTVAGIRPKMTLW
jgi:HSP90 family molecular chaperone